MDWAVFSFGAFAAREGVVRPELPAALAAAEVLPLCRDRATLKPGDWAVTSGTAGPLTTGVGGTIWGGGMDIDMKVSGCMTVGPGII